MHPKMAFRFRLALALLALLAFAAVAQAAAPFPAPRGAVNDFAGVIGAPEAARMEQLAREVLEKTGTALVVATVTTVGDDDPNDYANRLYQAWGIGKKGQDRGVLFFLAMTERRVRIETGYGLEGILPDGLAGEILDRYALPAFKERQYGRGFLEAMGAVARIVAKDAGVTLTGLPASRSQRQARPDRVGPLQLVFLLAAVAFLLGTRRGRAMLPWLLLLLTSGSGGRRGGGGGFDGFGGGFGGFGGGMSGGGGAGRSF